MKFEYRLRWQRLGLQATSKIMQTGRGATEKAERMLRLDEDKHEIGGASIARMPDLVWMTLQRRPVGEWEDVMRFDVPDPDPASEYQPPDRAPIVDDDGVRFDDIPF